MDVVESLKSRDVAAAAGGSQLEVPKPPIIVSLATEQLGRVVRFAQADLLNRRLPS